MTFAAALRAAGIEDGDRLGPEHWPASRASYPGATPFFLEDGFLADAAARMEWAPGLSAAVREAAGRFRASEARMRLLWHAHHLLYVAKAGEPKGGWVYPAFGADAGMFPLLALLSGLPGLLAEWNRRGVPPEVQRATLSDVELWATVYRANHGAWGLRDLGWLLCHFGGTLFRLGRIQFMPGVMPRFAYVFRHRTNRAVRLLCPDGVLYDAAGAAYWRRGAEDEPGIWTAAYRHEHGTYRGSPITEDAVAVRGTVELAEAEWERVLAPGDPVLDLHIPAGDPLTPGACRASIEQAREFFPRHLPDHPFRGMACWAWLLDPAFRVILPADANIVRFQDLFHRFPVPGNTGQVLERIFGEKRPDLTHAPRGNRLREAVTAYLARGGTFAGAGGGVLREDLQ